MMDKNDGIKSNNYMFHLDKTCSLYLHKVNRKNDYQIIKQYLTLEEMKYADKLKFEKRLHSYLLGRYVAKKAIADFSAIEQLDTIQINQGVFHQPYVSTATLNAVDISLTHCDDIGGAIAFSKECLMGIDIEEVSTKNAEVIATQCSVSEMQIIKSMFKDVEIGLTINWCLKEAMAKAIKTGFTVPIELFEINEIVELEQCFIAKYKNFRQYSAIAVHFDEYICAIAIPKDKMSNEIICLMKKIRFAF